MSESKKYKERLGKKVKDMTAAEKREYARLRKQDSRAGRVKGNEGKPAKKKKLNCAVMTKGGKTFTVCNKVGPKKPGNKYAGGKGANRPGCRSGKAKKIRGAKPGEQQTTGCGYNPKLKKYGDRGDGKKIKRKPKEKAKPKAKPKKKMNINTFYGKKK